MGARITWTRLSEPITASCATAATTCDYFQGHSLAAPPFGVHRLRPPNAVEPWGGVRDAPAFGPYAVANSGVRVRRLTMEKMRRGRSPCLPMPYITRDDIMI
jgi:carboxylesterase type B